MHITYSQYFALFNDDGFLVSFHTMEFIPITFGFFFLFWFKSTLFPLRFFLYDHFLYASSHQKPTITSYTTSFVFFSLYFFINIRSTKLNVCFVILSGILSHLFLHSMWYELKCLLPYHFVVVVVGCNNNFLSLVFCLIQRLKYFRLIWLLNQFCMNRNVYFVLSQTNFISIRLKSNHFFLTQSIFSIYEMFHKILSKIELR